MCSATASGGTDAPRKLRLPSGYLQRNRCWVSDVDSPTSFSVIAVANGDEVRSRSSMVTLCQRFKGVESILDNNRILFGRAQD